MNCARNRRQIRKLVIPLFLFFAPAVLANQITYTLSGDLSGTIGTRTLTDAAFVWTEVADTNGVTMFASQRYDNSATSSEIDIAGLSDATVTDSVAIEVDQRDGKGTITMANSAITFGIQLTDPTDVDSWTSPLTTSFGPITGGADSAAFVSNSPLNTSLGPLSLTAVDLSFEATASPVPEPASAGLVAGALMALAWSGSTTG